MSSTALLLLSVGCTAEIGPVGDAMGGPGPDAAVGGDDATTEPEPDAGTEPPPMGDAGAPLEDAASVADASTPVDAAGASAFVEVDGLVSFEAEAYARIVNDDVAGWFTFAAGSPDPAVTCATNVSCGDADARPDCNEYPNCDGDAIDPGEASGGAYVEALPDRRRDDSEAGTGGGLGLWNTPGDGPTLIYEVTFTNPGRYYVWGRARGQGPAANGLHVGIDGTWPRNDLIDPSTMRMQFPSGWGWTQNRRGGTNHTGVPAGDGVSRRDANIWIEVDTPGVHTIELAMREDGLELDKFVLTRDPDFTPTGDGPPETRP